MDSRQLSASGLREQFLLNQLAGLDDSLASYLMAQLNINTTKRTDREEKAAARRAAKAERLSISESATESVGNNLEAGSQTQDESSVAAGQVEESERPQIVDQSESFWAKSETPPSLDQAESLWAKSETPLSADQSESLWAKSEKPPSVNQAESLWAKSETPLSVDKSESLLAKCETPPAVNQAEQMVVTCEPLSPPADHLEAQSGNESCPDDINDELKEKTEKEPETTCSSLLQNLEEHLTSVPTKDVDSAAICLPADICTVGQDSVAEPRQIPAACDGQNTTDKAASGQQGADMPTKGTSLVESPQIKNDHEAQSQPVSESTDIVKAARTPVIVPTHRGISGAKIREHNAAVPRTFPRPPGARPSARCRPPVVVAAVKKTVVHYSDSEDYSEDESDSDGRSIIGS